MRRHRVDSLMPFRTCGVALVTATEKQFFPLIDEKCLAIYATTDSIYEIQFSARHKDAFIRTSSSIIRTTHLGTSDVIETDPDDGVAK